MSLSKNALFIFEVGEHDLWIEKAQTWIEDLTSKPFSISVRSITNRDLRESHLEGKDLVFLANIRMPEPNGFVILSRLQQLSVDIPVVVSSAMSSEPFFRELSRRGIALKGQITFLEKPFTLQTLSDVFLDLLFLQLARRRVSGLELVRLEPISLDVISHLAAHTHELFAVPGRFFEELLAELLHDRGWEVELAPIGADGGVDIIAIRRSTDFSQMMLVQAKRYAEHRKVGVGAVRELLHVIDAKRATCGMLATTSSFARPAEVEQHAYRWRLTLVDHMGIVRWLSEYKRRRSASDMSGD